MSNTCLLLTTSLPWTCPGSWPGSQEPSCSVCPRCLLLLRRGRRLSDPRSPGSEALCSPWLYQNFPPSAYVCPGVLPGSVPPGLWVTDH